MKLIFLFFIPFWGYAQSPEDYFQKGYDTVSFKKIIQSYSPSDTNHCIYCLNSIKSHFVNGVYTNPFECSPQGHNNVGVGVSALNGLSALNGTYSTTVGKCGSYQPFDYLGQNAPMINKDGTGNVGIGAASLLNNNTRESSLSIGLTAYGCFWVGTVTHPPTVKKQKGTKKKHK